MSVDAILNVFRSLDKHFTSAIPPSADTARKSYMTSQGQKDATNAGLGSVEAGTPIVRYWTVKYERGGRTHFTAVEACDLWKASLVVFKRHEGLSGVQVVREIQRDEFEHLTRSSP